MSQQQGDLLQRAIAAVRAGDKEAARQHLVQFLRANPQSEAAWMWMSAAVETRGERVHCLRKVLEINPANETARRGLEALGALEPAADPAAALTPASAMPITTEAPGGVPFPDERAVSAAWQEADALLQALAGEASVSREVEWALRPLAPRPAERRSEGLTLSPLVLAIGGSVILVIAVVVAVSAISGAVRRGVRTADQPEDTPDLPAAADTTAGPPTATATLPPRPTRTPSPAGEGAILVPTLPVGDAPRGDLRIGLTPTPAYVLTPHPDDPDLEAAIAAYHAGGYAEAADLLGDSGGANAPPDAAYYRVMAALKQGDAQAAAALVESAVTRYEDFAPLHAALGDAYLALGEAPLAAAQYARALELDPQLVAAYVGQARAALAQGDAGAALAAVQAGRGVHPYDINLLIAASDIYRSGGQPSDALAYASLAYYVDPAAEGSNLALARSMLTLGDIGTAMIALEDYLYEIDPESAEAWALLGQAYALQGRSADASAAYDRALQLTDDPAPVLAIRGQQALAMGDLEGAYGDLTAALESAPSRELRLARAEAAYGTGRYDEAAADYEAAGEAGVLPAEAAARYARALTQSGASSDAARAATERLEADAALTPDEQAALLEARGLAYLELGRNGAALDDANAALALRETGTGYYVRGAALAGLGDYEAAARALEWVQVWAGAYDYPFAADAAALLGEANAELAAAQATATPTSAP